MSLGRGDPELCPLCPWHLPQALGPPGQCGKHSFGPDPCFSSDEGEPRNAGGLAQRPQCTEGTVSLDCRHGPGARPLSSHTEEAGVSSGSALSMTGVESKILEVVRLMKWGDWKFTIHTGEGSYDGKLGPSVQGPSVFHLGSMGRSRRPRQGVSLPAFSSDLPSLSAPSPAFSSSSQQHTHPRLLLLTLASLQASQGLPF